MDIVLDISVGNYRFGGHVRVIFAPRAVCVGSFIVYYLACVGPSGGAMLRDKSELELELDDVKFEQISGKSYPELH